MWSPLALVLRDTCLDELPHQRRGEGLVGRKSDRALGDDVGCERLLERPCDVGAHEDTAAALERCLAHHHPPPLQHRAPLTPHPPRLPPPPPHPPPPPPP